MLRAYLLPLFMLLLSVSPARAGTAEVRDAAQQNGCPPKKIEVLRQSIGATSQTVYQVECNLPKAKDQSSKAGNTLIIKCELNLCQAMR